MNEAWDKWRNKNAEWHDAAIAEAVDQAGAMFKLGGPDGAITSLLAAMLAEMRMQRATLDDICDIVNDIKGGS